MRRQSKIGGRGGLRPLLCALSLAVCLTGCAALPTAREMGDMALLRTLGVDAAPAGVAVTGSTGPRAKGLQAEGEPALTLAADRASLSGACLAMQGQGDSFVFFGYVDQLLIGEELARGDVEPVLDYFARDVELGLGAQLWLVRGDTARQAVLSGGQEGLDSRLETLQTDSKMGIARITRTAGEVYTDLLEQGAAFAPALALDGEAGALTEYGYGILREGALTGYLEGEAARGLELLVGGPSADVLEVERPGGQTAVRVLSARTGSALEFQGDIPRALRLKCQVEACLSEYRPPLEGGAGRQLAEAVEARERARIQAALELLQAWRSDCAGLGAKAAVSRPAQWQAVRENWPEWFARLPVELEVRVTVRR